MDAEGSSAPAPEALNRASFRPPPPPLDALHPARFSFLYSRPTAEIANARRKEGAEPEPDAEGTAWETKPSLAHSYALAEGSAILVPETAAFAPRPVSPRGFLCGRL